MHDEQGKEYMEVRLKALTPIWTGGMNPRARTLDRLHETGIMGSLRWWFEVLVRGFGGKVCDPTNEVVRCPDKNREPSDHGHHCVVCELFGCTGWARKFRLMILDENGEETIKQIEQNQKFTFRFIPLRPIRDEEWCLLDLTLRLIADYGAMGGKTVFKPSNEMTAIGDLELVSGNFVQSDRRVKINGHIRGDLRKGDIIVAIDDQTINSIEDIKGVIKHKEHGEDIEVSIERRGKSATVESWAGKMHHKDYGIIALEQVCRPSETRYPEDSGQIRMWLRNYILESSWRKPAHSDKEHDFSWASLENFWCVEGKYLERIDYNKSTFNRVIGRPEKKNQSKDNDSWLAGFRANSKQKQKAVSKKVFSFKVPDGGRTFGFVKPDTVNFDEMKECLSKMWGKEFIEKKFLQGKDILDELLTKLNKGGQS